MPISNPRKNVELICRIDYVTAMFTVVHIGKYFFHSEYGLVLMPLVWYFVPKL